MKTLFISAIGLAFLTGLTTGTLSAEPSASVNAVPPSANDTQPQIDYEHHAIEDVLVNPADQKPVKITGEIIKKIECGTYLFRGESGDIRIRIDTHAVPEQGLPFREATVIRGTVNHNGDTMPTIEADHIHYVF